MGILDFVKEAGEALLGKAQAAEPPPPGPDADAANRAAGEAIEKYIGSQGLSATALSVEFDGATRTATARGVAPDQATKEKILLCCGNVKGVEKVNDQMSVSTASAEANYYTVKSGDTLSAISKAQYGDANKYNAIFEANKPMLSSPDKIYPGQVLRIPPL
ncbi:MULTISPECIES: peptidoglycan-binding protein LysM [Pandoraea]|uniref:Peptidoglycan-binding protein LysM n=1 Tax=Pandoraea capi TaxID=2508286 RepID=A0ABY6WBN1_9BURK|nr:MULTISPECIES: peptidoglycan-binding protein LysM [Pandoraea]ODP32750.1 peptidoglycan-binding protein LysM [Pandoraea sp. ISTKB]VVE52332.1 peptidoglycan-binding protein LysM [Pandoraea capi]